MANFPDQKDASPVWWCKYLNQEEWLDVVLNRPVEDAVALPTDGLARRRSGAGRARSNSFGIAGLAQARA